MSLNDELLKLGLRLSVESEGKTLDLFDIEQTILDALEEVVTKNDARLFAVLASWIKVHGERLILVKLISRTNSLARMSPVRNLVKALLIVGAENNLINFKQSVAKVAVSSSFAFRGKGKADFDTNKFNQSYKPFHKAKFYLSEGSLRIRESDVLPPAELASLNEAYRARVRFGSNWRAEVFYLRSKGIKTAYKAAKLCGCSKETARKLFHDYALLAG